MCTVTYLPLSDTNFILTSSRDVSYRRAPALVPAEYLENGVTVFYPKDGQAGGTWIGSSRESRLICLLNGGFKEHQDESPYRMSRGRIVIDLLVADDFVQKSSDIDLNRIEPFTLVVVDWAQDFLLFEFVWDGKDRHLRTLENRPHIWSSSTLFDIQMKNAREDWFSNWLESDPSFSDIKEFHRNAGSDDPEVAVLLRRKIVGTVSITQFFKEGDSVRMDYEPIA